MTSYPPAGAPSGPVVDTLASANLVPLDHTSIPGRFPPLPVDNDALDWAVTHRSQGVDAVATAFTNIGSTALSIPVFVVLACVLVYALRSWLPALTMAGVAAVSVPLTSLLKELCQRPRPEHAKAVAPYMYSPSFPSGHSLNAMALALAAGYFGVLAARRYLWPRITQALMLLATGFYPIAMGSSRVFLGHHWTTDVLAGWAMGLVIGTVAIALAAWGARRYRTRYAQQCKNRGTLLAEPTPLPLAI